MEEVRKDAAQCFVALLAEGVDRNIDAAIKEMDEVGRPPRGGRG